MGDTIKKMFCGTADKEGGATREKAKAGERIEKTAERRGFTQASDIPDGLHLLLRAGGWPDPERRCQDLPATLIHAKRFRILAQPPVAGDQAAIELLRERIDLDSLPVEHHG